MAPNLIKDTPDEEVVNLEEIPNPSSFALEGGRLTVKGHPFLLDVPSNIVVTNPFSSQKGSVPTNGLFLGFHAAVPKSWHAAPIGKLLGIRFMSIFRFKVWWTSLWVGERGREVENETQMMILEKSAFGRPYVLLLPLVERSFRSSLRAGEEDNVELCVESGSTKVVSNAFRASLYVHAGDDPYKLVKEAMKAVRAHLGTFRLLEEKTPPGIVDKFGWCTWDAFYLKVHPEGVLEGVQGLVEGGCPPGMVLIDDGWQSICHDEDPITEQDCMNKTAPGEQMPCRLIKFQENHKFRNYQSKRESANSGALSGMGAFVRDLKETFESVEHVYVWHALCGYWGGLRPHVPSLPESKVVTPKPSPGVKMLMEDLAVDKIVNNGVGMVAPDEVGRMFEELHSHLDQAGIDGVKVDVIHLLEMLCEDFGGRVELAKVYYKAISASIKKHFKGNGVIASMEHCNDFMFLGTETISLGRVGDDFWCTDSSGDPNGSFWLQGCHMVHCAYNSLWMGNFIHPDWDMFQSTHPCAKFHAASRAISGGPIYISDVVGKHDFNLLRTLVIPDGSILRCNSYALPTRDCLFEDPLHDGKTMLKIWNLNKFSGILGAFNCQGGGWCPQSRTNKCFSEFSHLITSTVSPNNVEWENGNASISIKGVQLFATYMYQAKKLLFLKPEETLEISLQPYNFELFTISPVFVLPEKKGQFAAIGLVNMMNSGGAIQSLEIFKGNSVRVGVRGTGEMRAFSSKKPISCRIHCKEVAFNYDEKMVVIQIPWPNSSGGLSIIEYLF